MSGEQKKAKNNRYIFGITDVRTNGVILSPDHVSLQIQT